MLREINIKKGVFIAIGGPSGSGKSTAINGLKKHYGHQVYESLTYTTRQPRKGEIDGKHYNFVNVDQMPHFQGNSRYTGFVKARENWYWIDSLELMEDSRKNPNGIYLTAITQVNEFVERQNIFPDLRWIWLTATSSELCSRLTERGDADVEGSRKHNELLEKQNRCKLISLEIDTEDHNPEETLRQIINFIEKVREGKQ